jgi:hypothetical protein
MVAQLVTTRNAQTVRKAMALFLMVFLLPHGRGLRCWILGALLRIDVMLEEVRRSVNGKKQTKMERAMGSENTVHQGGGPSRLLSDRHLTAICARYPALCLRVQIEIRSALPYWKISECAFLRGY